MEQQTRPHPNLTGDQMPNWCHNRVSFYSENTEQVSKLYEIFNSDNPFQQIKPSPDWKTTPNADGELPVLKEHKNPDGKVVFTTNEFPKSGKNDDRWYDWNINNWGTKWDVDPECDHFESNCFECEFETAWSPAEGIYYAIQEKFPDVSISWFFDEPGMEFAGYLPH